MFSIILFMCCFGLGAWGQEWLVEEFYIQSIICFTFAGICYLLGLIALMTDEYWMWTKDV